VDMNISMDIHGKSDYFVFYSNTRNYKRKVETYMLIDAFRPNILFLLQTENEAYVQIVKFIVLEMGVEYRCVLTALCIV